jgi:predicted nucleotidyltransferase
MDKGLKKDLEKAVAILKEFGATEVYLFGSQATGKARKDSDLDLAERGIPARKFFEAYGKVLMALDHEVHLIALDKPTDFSKYLQSKGELRVVG